MTRRFSLWVPAAMAGALFCSTAAPAQDDRPNPTIAVTVDGLACGSPAQGWFTASAFAIDVTTTSSGDGAAAGKSTLTDLAILKVSDACSVPLFRLAASGRIVPRVVIAQTDKGLGTVLTMTLENVEIANFSLRKADFRSVAGVAEESLDLSYTAITISDNAGHTTGRIRRPAGSVPIAPFATQGSSREI